MCTRLISNGMDLLTEIAIKYGSDRQPLSKHSYTPYYFELFKDRIGEIEKILEIGVGSDGAGLRMWRDFFPNANIYGAEIDQNRIFTDGRIQVFYCDQASQNDLMALLDKTGHDLDFVVEDASHKPEDQVFTCLTLMPYLKSDVVYIIEDVADASIVEKLSPYYDVEVPQLIPKKKRYDDRLVVVRHRKNNIRQRSYSRDPETTSPPSISIFAKRAFLNTNPSHEFISKEVSYRGHGHLLRVSSIIRGDQIAQKLGVKLNPKNGFENDVCIYVKPHVKPGEDFKFEGKGYLDIIDGSDLFVLARKHPEIGVISMSDWNYEMLKRVLPNKIVNIPQQHCNFERVRRTRNEITRVGIIGTARAFTYLPPDLKPRLTERGVELIEFSKFFSRQDVVDFYMKIDVQIIWRPYFDYRKDILMNPLKIVNSSSFGIPTIAYDEPVFKEMDGCYIPVHTLGEFLAELDKLRSDSELYDKYAKRCIEKSEEYHIEEIAKLYRNLASL